MKRLIAVLVLFSIGCAHVAQTRAPAAAEKLPEKTLRSILAFSSEAGQALVQTIVVSRQLTYEVCPVDLNTLKTNAEVLRYLNSGVQGCVNVNPILFDTRQPRATDIIDHITSRKLEQVAQEWVAAKKVPANFEKGAKDAISQVFTNFRSQTYSGDLNLSEYRLKAREIYVSTLAALVQLTTDWNVGHATTLYSPDDIDSELNTLERALAQGGTTDLHGADVFKLLVEATDRATQTAGRRLKLIH